MGVASAPVYDNGELKLVYTHGDLCTLPPDGPHYPRNTTIILSCGATLGSPVFTSEVGCNYVFSWETSAACDRTPLTGTDCKVTDPVTGTTIDLSPLAAKGPFKLGADSSEMVVGLCKDAGSPCAAGVGACAKSFSFGHTSSALEVVDGSVSLTYTGGTQCPSGKGSTLIEFK